MATPSSILAWKVPWTEEPDGLQSMGSQRAGHDLMHMHTHIPIQNKKVFLKNKETGGKIYLNLFLVPGLEPAVLSRPGSPASSLELSLMILCVPPMLCRGLTRCLEALQPARSWSQLESAQFQEGSLVNNHSLRLAWCFLTLIEQAWAVDTLTWSD